MQRVEQLALIFMQALDLHVKHRVRIKIQALMARNPAGETLLVAVLDLSKALKEGRVIGKGKQLFKIHQVAAPSLTDGFIQKRGKIRIGPASASGAA